MAQSYAAPSQVSNAEYLRWNQAPENVPYPDPSSYNMNNYAGNGLSQPQFEQPIQTPSTQLARRPVNRQLVQTGQRTAYDTANPWGQFGDDAVLDPQNANGTMEETDDIDRLEERATVAKRDAQAKRKQIPPFVQKLSSFLDDGKNTELIRWSDRGDSFVVLDEDEFAKTLIPELFKHNNYASFVRQLNMYGFHKRVGLSDNSMKASERKNKSPSEYYNPYFKRGHPNLLWLINKPKGGINKKKAKTVKDERLEMQDGESDDDANIEEVYGNNIQASRALSAAPEAGPLQRREVAVLQNQLAEIQKQQGNITNAIQRLRKDHNQLYQQSMAFQTLHDRHENSINAILTFLATVYNRSLDGQGVPQNIAQMFANGIPHNDQQNQGSVVDIGDASNQQQPHPGSMSPHRRQQRLLMAPPKSGNGRASTASPSVKIETPTPSPGYSNTPQPGAIEELFDASPTDSTSPQTKPAHQAQPDMMMSLINNTNAQNPSNGNNMEFPEMLSHYENANGNTPLTNEERNTILSSMMANSSQATVNTNNAIASPIAPEAPLADIQYTQAEIEALLKLQDEQNNHIDHVKGTIIPGIDNCDPYFNSMEASDPNNSNLDLDQYLDSGAFYAGSSPLAHADYDAYGNYDQGMSMGDSHFDVGMDGTDERGVVETMNNSEAATPEEGNPEMMNGNGNSGVSSGIRSPTKKRRKN